MNYGHKGHAACSRVWSVADDSTHMGRICNPPFRPADNASTRVTKLWTRGFQPRHRLLATRPLPEPLR
jgi:hypothetical protein